MIITAGTIKNVIDIKKDGEGEISSVSVSDKNINILYASRSGSIDDVRLSVDVLSTRPSIFKYYMSMLEKKA